LALVVHSISPQANLRHALQHIGEAIPEKYMPELLSRDKEREAKFQTGGFPFIDKRKTIIQDNLKVQFFEKLQQLRQAGLINWEMGVKNNGENSSGPYVVNFMIFFTVKLFELKKLNSEFKFLITPKGKSLANLILE
jgi:hypothetical protein